MKFKNLKEDEAFMTDIESDPDILLIGIGNELRGDDAVGLLIARELEKASLPGIAILEESGEGAALIEAWEGHRTVFLFDAVSTGNFPPGTIYRFDANADKIPADFFHYSTHHFSVAEAIELSRSLNRLPEKLVVYGIEGVNFDYGIHLSPAIEKAMLKIVEEIKLELLEKTT